MIHELADDNVCQDRGACHTFADRSKRQRADQNPPFLGIFLHVGFTYHLVTNGLQDIYFCRDAFQA